MKNHMIEIQTLKKFFLNSCDYPNNFLEQPSFQRLHIQASFERLDIQAVKFAEQVNGFV